MRPTSRELLLRIDDGDSPALADLKVEALVEPPALVFDLQADARLLFGGG